MLDMDVPPASHCFWKTITPQIIIGKYCTLEPINYDHLDGLFTIFSGNNAKELFTYVTFGAVNEKNDLKQHFIDNDPSEIGFCIIENSSNRPLGFTSFHTISEKHGTTEISAFFAKEMQNTTMATEAIYLMLRELFNNFGYRRCQWHCVKANLASNRASQRIGFRFEGVMRNHYHFKNQTFDTMWYSILANEWPEINYRLSTWLYSDNFILDTWQQIFSLNDIIPFKIEINPQYFSANQQHNQIDTKPWQDGQLPPPYQIYNQDVTLIAIDPEIHGSALYDLLHYQSSNDIFKFLPFGPFANNAIFIDFLKKQAQQFGYYVIFDNYSRLPFGIICYLNAFPEHGTIELGSIMNTHDLLSKKQLLNALYLMLEEAFERLHFSRCQWQVDEGDLVTRLALKHCGFKHENTIRQKYIHKDTPRNYCWYSILKHEWPEVKQNFIKLGVKHSQLYH